LGRTGVFCSPFWDQRCQSSRDPCPLL
jgi:hypothetical protein